MNDGNIKVVANKFYWTYLRPDKVSLIKSLYVKFQSIALTSNTTFWWGLQTQTEWVIFERARTNNLVPRTQNLENPIFTFGCFSLKAVYNSCKLQRLAKCNVFVYVLLYYFTFQALNYWIGTFINVCFQMKCFHGDSSSFF